MQLIERQTVSGMQPSASSLRNRVTGWLLAGAWFVPSVQTQAATAGSTENHTWLEPTMNTFGSVAGDWVHRESFARFTWGQIVLSGA